MRCTPSLSSPDTHAPRTRFRIPSSAFRYCRRAVLARLFHRPLPSFFPRATAFPMPCLQPSALSKKERRRRRHRCPARALPALRRSHALLPRGLCLLLRALLGRGRRLVELSARRPPHAPDALAPIRRRVNELRLLARARRRWLQRRGRRRHRRARGRRLCLRLFHLGRRRTLLSRSARSRRFASRSRSSADIGGCRSRSS